MKSEVSLMFSHSPPYLLSGNIDVTQHFFSMVLMDGCPHCCVFSKGVTNLQLFSCSYELFEVLCSNTLMNKHSRSIGANLQRYYESYIVPLTKSDVLFNSRNPRVSHINKRVSPSSQVVLIMPEFYINGRLFSPFCFGVNEKVKLSNYLTYHHECKIK